MFLLSIQCCIFYFYFHPLVVQSRPTPGDKNKHGTTKYHFDEHNMYTDPRHPFYSGRMKTSKAFKIFLKIAWENITRFWRLFTYRLNAAYGTAPPYGATAPHYGTHVAGAPAPPYGAYPPHGAGAPAPPYGGPYPPHGAAAPAQPYAAPVPHNGAVATAYLPTYREIKQNT